MMENKDVMSLSDIEWSWLTRTETKTEFPINVKLPTVEQWFPRYPS